MEDHIKLLTIEETQQRQTSQNKYHRRSSMKKRLSGHMSHQDFFKDITNQIKMTSTNEKQKSFNSKPLKRKKVFELQELVNLSENALTHMYNTDPFLKRGLNILAKNNVENQYKKSKKISDIKKLAISHDIVNSRTHYMMIKSKEQEMFKKVIKTLGENF